MDLGESDLKPLDQDRLLAEQEATIAMKEAEDKFDSISNRVADQSVFTKLTSKTQISDLRKQLEKEKEARGKIEAEMNELK